MLRNLAAALTLILPWGVRRRVLEALFGFEIHSTARIGFSWVVPRRLVVGPHARIGHLNVIRQVQTVILEEGGTIGGLNWITANLESSDEIALDERTSQLVLRFYAGMTTRHYLDCSATIELAKYAVLGGVRSVLLSHHMDVHKAIATCRPIRVGEQSLVSTNCMLLGGAELPDRSVLGASSLLMDAPKETHRLYAGIPAREVSAYAPDLAWFQRSIDVLNAQRRTPRRTLM
jgi:serine acetyltransferase